VLSRWPIVASAVHRLPGENPVSRLATDCRPPNFGGDPTCLIDIVLEPRAAVWTRIRTAVGTVSFTSAHTSGNWLQSNDLARWARSRSARDPSAYLVCDCNSVPGSPAHQVMSPLGWVDSWRLLHFGSAGYTTDQDIGATGPTVDARIDYVFVRSDSRLRPLTSDRFMDKPQPSTLEPSGLLWPSDHWGVIDTVA
jgi:endonuclease/exonuclease/phosphatase family metal-dependent hydrolase